MRVRCRSRLFFALFLLLVSAPSLLAQTAPVPTPPELRLRWYQEHVALVERSPFKHLHWQFLGPTNISGRMTDVAVVTPKGRNYTIYVAGASGGVWKTVNEGVTWEPVFQHAASTSIGDVTIAPSDPKIIWVGTGEANIFRSSMAGAGVYKSTDGGRSWQHMGLAGTHTIPRIVIHPTDPETVWVAASGHEWTPNPERGVYKSTDGGRNWRKVLYVNEHTGAIDLVIDPTDPDTLYAATWQRVRKKWNDPRNEPGYSGSGIYKSSDGGESWRPINEGLPAPEHRGRIGIDVARSSPNVLYAFIDNYEVARMPEEGETDAYGRPRAPIIRGATVFRSDDAGGHWVQTSSNDEFMQNLGGTYGWVFGQIRVDPTNPDKIYVMGLALNVSEDGGRSFRRLTGMHGDHHGLWIDPDNPNYLANVNDGGLAISYDGGEKWRSSTDNLPLAQFFNVAHDMDEPFHVYGSVQDHGSFRGAVDLSRGRNNIPAVEWERAPGGEGSSHAIDPTDPNTVYAAGFYGRIFRANLATDEITQIVPQAEEGEPPLRGQWLAPFIISPHNPFILYHGMNMLFRSMNRGDRWERISPDLTNNELDKIGDIPYQTIYSISESPLKFGLVYVGTDDGRIWVTDDGGADWSEITGELPRERFIAELVASHDDLGTVYAVQNGKRDDDFAPYLWKSTDFGKTWQNLAEGIPSGPINVVQEDPNNPEVLYVGTDLGVYVTLDGGASWQALATDLPTTFVQDLALHPRDDILVAATHGRGMWALDARPIQALTAEVREQPVHVFEIEPVRRPRQRFGFFGGRPNAWVHYWLREPGEVRVEVIGPDGKVVTTLEGSGDRGVNEAHWDLTLPATEAEDGGRRRAPVAPPGEYTVRVTAGGETATGTLRVEG